MGKVSMSRCWDCANATGGCSWANNLEPVEGWNTIEFKPTSTKPYSTHLVLDCPLFERDAYDGGVRRTPREIKLN